MLTPRVWALDASVRGSYERFILKIFRCGGTCTRPFWSQTCGLVGKREQTGSKKQKCRLVGKREQTGPVRTSSTSRAEAFESHSFIFYIYPSPTDYAGALGFGLWTPLCVGSINDLRFFSVVTLFWPPPRSKTAPEHPCFFTVIPLL